jgi:hypothetical protein
MIEIKHRFTGAMICRSETAETIAQAIIGLVEKAREQKQQANLSGAYLYEANLSGADLIGADLRGAYLYEAYLSGADLSGADLRGAYLIGADLRGAYLSRANLSGANLREANLRGAYLYEADLSGANLIGADLIEANLVSLGFDVRGYHFFLYYEKDQCVIRAGCRTFNIDHARRHWANKPEVLARLDLAESIAKNRGWNLRKEN